MHNDLTGSDQTCGNVEGVVRGSLRRVLSTTVAQPRLIKSHTANHHREYQTHLVPAREAWVVGEQRKACREEEKEAAAYEREVEKLKQRVGSHAAHVLHPLHAAHAALSAEGAEAFAARQAAVQPADEAVAATTESTYVEEEGERQQGGERDQHRSGGPCPNGRERTSEISAHGFLVNRYRASGWGGPYSG